MIQSSKRNSSGILLDECHKMQEGWNYLEVMKNKKTLASRLGNIVGKQGHDAKHSQSAVLELLKLEFSLHLRSFVN